MADEFMTAPEVAAYLRRTVQTLYHWRNHNVGPRATRVGRGLLYRRSDVDSWLADQAAEQRRTAASR